MQVPSQSCPSRPTSGSTIDLRGVNSHGKHRAGTHRCHRRVDTHKDLHVAVAIDGHGGPVGELSIEATNEGYAELLSWAASLGRIHGFGVEGCGSYGIGLARFLRRHGHPPWKWPAHPARGSAGLRASRMRSMPSTPHGWCSPESVWPPRSSRTDRSSRCDCSRSPGTLRSRQRRPR